MLSVKALGEDPLLPLPVSGDPRQSLAGGSIMPIFPHSHLPSPVCVCYRFLFLERHPIIGLMATLTLS